MIGAPFERNERREHCIIRSIPRPLPTKLQLRYYLVKSIGRSSAWNVCLQ